MLGGDGTPGYMAECKGYDMKMSNYQKKINTIRNTFDCVFNKKVDGKI